MADIASKELAEKRRRLSVRVQRHIPCNPPDSVRDVGTAILKVIDNIIANPDDLKYRELRAGNRMVHTKILEPHGGREILHMLGFEKITKHAEFIYYLDHVEASYLSEARAWLQEQIQRALSNTAYHPGGTCTECIIQVRLTTGQTLEGGFAADETLRSIYDFVHSSVVNSSEEVLLRSMQPAVDWTADKLDVTLGQAGLLPRSVLIVVKQSLRGTPFHETDMMTEVHQRDMAAERQAAVDLQRIKELKMSQQKVKDAEKERVLKEFNEDRQKAKDLHRRPSFEDGVEEVKGRR